MFIRKRTCKYEVAVKDETCENTSISDINFIIAGENTENRRNILFLVINSLRGSSFFSRVEIFLV